MPVYRVDGSWGLIDSTDFNLFTRCFRKLFRRSVFTLATPFQYLFLVYCSVEKLMHQRPNPIHFFFQREMARVEKMELCTGNISFIEFSTLHRKDSIVFTPSDQRGGLLFTEILLPIGIDIQIPFCVVED